MTRRRTPQPPAPTPEPTPDQGATMTIPTINLESDEPAEMLIRELRDADRIARDAHEKGAKALADADRIAQGVADLNRREDEIRAELHQIAEHRKKLQQQETDARTYAQGQHAERDRKAAAVTSYKQLLAVANVPIDEHLLVPTVANGNGHVPTPAAPMVELDPTEAARIDGPIGRMVAAEQAELTEKQRGGKAL